MKSEGGYVPFDNEIIEALYAAPLNGTELRLALFVVRKTWGWGKKSDRISISQIEKALKVSRKVACEAQNKLVTKKLLVVEKEGQYNRLSVNKRHHEWVVTEKLLGGYEKVTVLQTQQEKVVTEKTLVRRKKSAQNDDQTSYGKVTTTSYEKVTHNKQPKNNKFRIMNLEHSGDENFDENNSAENAIVQNEIHQPAGTRKVSRKRTDSVTIEDTQIVPVMETEALSKRAPNRTINELFAHWEAHYLPTRDGSGEKNRRAAWVLLEKHGKQEIMQLIESLHLLKHVKYAPSITSFMDLQDKWNKIGVAIMRHQQNSKEVQSV